MKITLELTSLNGVAREDSERPWQCYETAVVEFDPADEDPLFCGSIFTVDQDGGQAEEVQLHDLPVDLQNKLRSEIKEKLVSELKHQSVISDSALLESEQRGRDQETVNDLNRNR